MAISDKQLHALQNLSNKQAGEAVDFINIADARALTELGLARRTAEGWEITREGAALIAASPPALQVSDVSTLLPPGASAPSETSK